jgi:hypothetical protein
MSKTGTFRTVPVALALVVALVAGLAALAFTGGDSAAAKNREAQHAKGKITAKELAFRNDMRRLWEDHITWTRLAWRSSA